MTDSQINFHTWYTRLWGHPPFPWQSRYAAMLADGRPPASIAAPTASGKTSVIDAWVWAISSHPERVARRLWYVVQRRVLVDDAYQRALRIRDRLDSESRSRLESMSATSGSLEILRLRGGVFEDMGAIDISTPMLVCSTADQHMSRLLFRGYGVTDNSLPIHAALAGTNSTIAIDEAHIIPTYEENLRRCQALGAEIQIVSMTATPTSADGSVLRLSEQDRGNPVLSLRLSKAKRATLTKGKPTKLVQLATRMTREGCRAVVVFCNTANTAADVAAAIPNSFLLTGRVREFDRNRMDEILRPLRSGAQGPSDPTVVVATQTLEVGADLDFDGLVTECASLSALRQRFGRLDRLGSRPDPQAAIVWDGKKKTPVYGEAAGNVFQWLHDALGDNPDMSTDSINGALEESPPTTMLDLEPDLGPKVSDELIETWRQTNPRPVWDVPVADFIDPSDDTNVTLVWRDEALIEALVESFPPHPVEAAPVPIGAVRAWAGERLGVRWRGPETAAICDSGELRPGDVWVLEAAVDDGRVFLGCVLPDSPADVGDVAGERVRVSEELAEAINDGMSIDEIAESTGIERPVVSARGDGYVVHARRSVESLSSSGSPIELGAHCQAVADLAGQMASKLGLDSQLLTVAGALHDIGKADHRMQAWMGGAPDKLLAKSGQSAKALRQMRPDELPKGWRHELLSARMLPDDASDELLDLVATHHGRCRPAPPLCGEDGHAAITYAGGRFEADEGDPRSLEAIMIERSARLGNPWITAHKQAVLVMADRIASRDDSQSPIQTCSVPIYTTQNSNLAFVASPLIGTTLIGWMAAVGALRMLSQARDTTTLNWNEADQAVFSGWEIDEAISFVYDQAKVAPPVFKPTNESEFNSLGEWGPAVWRFDGDDIKQSPLLATGGGLTGLERAWPKLAEAMTAEKIREAIEGPWVYHKKLGQRWDTAEHAEHGSQWADPSREGSRSVHGANRLAIEALPLVPTLGVRTTIGFDYDQQAVTWPLWREPLTVAGVRVAVRQPMLERWMSRKISVGQLASFLVAEPCERRGGAENAVSARS